MIERTSRNNLLLALGLSVALLVLSYARIVGDSQTMVFRSEVLDTIFAGSIWGTALMWNVVGFAAAMLVLHLGYGAFCWLVGTLSAKASNVPGVDPARAQRQHVVLWFAFLTLALLVHNSARFPNSSLGSPYRSIMTTQLGGVPLGSWIAGAIFLAATAAALHGIISRWRAGWRPYRNPRRFAACSLAVVALAGASGWATSNHTRNDGGKPNLVLIGIDSLRSDVVGNHAPQDAAPHLRAFLQQSAWFTDAMTPLARTFPSMLSILTGRHPHKTGAYMNLPPRDAIHEGETLGRIFNRAGYRSIYAMDEVRFANIDTSYGFDQVISPPIGASEFLLSLIADTPLSNFAMNSLVGKLLFPHIHANRGAATTYDPDAFVARIDQEIDFDQPLFFTTHLTLSHWPYFWATAQPKGPKTSDLWPKYYLDVVRRVDQQFADLMRVLEQRGVLDNAIVVVYSDHGESFGKAIEALVPAGNSLITALAATPQWGHGSSVLSSHQFKVVLGMRGFGAAAGTMAARQISAPVSVMDIAPTLTQLVGARTETPFDGISLMPLIENPAAPPPQFTRRIRFTETEYTPVGVATASGKLSASGLTQAAELYLVDPVTDRVQVRRSLLEPMLGIRQFAAIGDELMLAALPYRKEGLSHHFVVLSKSGGLPRLLSAAPDADAPEELQRLWTAMQTTFPGIVPSQQQLEQVVAESAVAHNDQSPTLSVTK